MDKTTIAKIAAQERARHSSLPVGGHHQEDVVRYPYRIAGLAHRERPPVEWRGLFGDAALADKKTAGGLGHVDSAPDMFAGRSSTTSSSVSHRSSDPCCV